LKKEKKRRTNVIVAVVAVILGTDLDVALGILGITGLC